LLLGILGAQGTGRVPYVIRPIVCPVIAEPSFFKAKTASGGLSHVSLDLDEVGVLQHRLAEWPSISAGIYRGPFREIYQCLTVENQWRELVAMAGVPLKAHACEGESNRLAADGSLRVIWRHPGPIDAVLASRVNLESGPRSHSDLGI
jgi:hypothetical protein